MIRPVPLSCTTILSLLTLTSAQGAELPLAHTYGDADGCNYVLKNVEPKSDNYRYFAAKGYGGYQWTCRFLQVFTVFKHEREAVFTAIATCMSFGGAFYPELLTVHEYPGTLDVHRSDNGVERIKQCP